MIPNSKSTGQFGSSSDRTTEDPSATSEAQQQRKERGEKTAENIRYGQTISEGGMSGFTTGQGESGGEQSGYGGVQGQSEQSSAGADRVAQGYGGKEDQNREIGA